jgi:hypothetical protein
MQAWTLLATLIINIFRSFDKVEKELKLVLPVNLSKVSSLRIPNSFDNKLSGKGGLISSGRIYQLPKRSQGIFLVLTCSLSSLPDEEIRTRL